MATGPAYCGLGAPPVHSRQAHPHALCAGVCGEGSGAGHGKGRWERRLCAHSEGKGYEPTCQGSQLPFTRQCRISIIMAVGKSKGSLLQSRGGSCSCSGMGVLLAGFERKAMLQWHPLTCCNRRMLLPIRTSGCPQIDKSGAKRTFHPPDKLPTFYEEVPAQAPTPPLAL